MGRVIACSSGPEPFPGVAIKEPLVPQQPGEVLIRYELEAVSFCGACLPPLQTVLSCLAASHLHIQNMPKVIFAAPVDCSFSQ